MPNKKKAESERLSEKVSVYLNKFQHKKYTDKAKEKDLSLSEYIINRLENSESFTYTINFDTLIATVEVYKCSNFKCAKFFYLSNSTNDKIISCPYCRNDYPPQKTGLSGRIMKFEEKFTNRIEN